MARQLVIDIVSDAAKFSKSLQAATRDAGTFGDKVGAAGKQMTAFATVPIVGFLGAATKAAIEDAAAQDRLAQVLKNVKGGGDALVKSVEGQITAMQKTSTFTDDQLRPAYQNLIVATKDVAKTQDLMGAAMDIAAAKGLDLETVTTAMAKAHAGNTGALGKLGIATKDAAGEALTFEQIMKNAAATFGGSAQAAAETTSGKMQNLKRDMGELAEKVGTSLIPILTTLADKALPVIDGFSKMDAGTQTMVVGAGLAVAAIGPLITAIRGIGVALTFVAAHPVILFLAALAEELIRLEKLFTSLDRKVKDKGFLGALKGVVDIIPVIGVPKALGIKLPGFATGGVVPGPAGAATPIIAHGGERILPRGAAGGGGTTIVNINVAGSVLTERQLTEVVHDGLLQKQRRGGSLGFVAA